MGRTAVKQFAPRLAGCFCVRLESLPGATKELKK